MLLLKILQNLLYSATNELKNLLIELELNKLLYKITSYFFNLYLNDDNQDKTYYSSIVLQILALITTFIYQHNPSKQSLLSYFMDNEKEAFTEEEEEAHQKKKKKKKKKRKCN